MRDIYVMNRKTGELIPSEKAIKEFYKTHGIMDDWTDEYQETKMETSNEMRKPDFTNIF